MLPDWSGRLRRLADAAVRSPVDALVVSSPPNVRYLTGFEGTAGLLAISRDGSWLAVDGRYVTALEEGLSAGTIGPVQPMRVTGRYDDALASLVTERGWSCLGFEAAHLTVAGLRHWEQSCPGVEWRATQDAVEGLRVIKDATEQAILREAGRRLSAVAGQLVSWIGPGRTERQVARAIEAGLETAGFSRPAFPTIVASGPNSALPHARPGDRQLAAGDLVVLDFGGVLDGYCVDLTRMAALQPVAPERQALFDAVREAQAKALAAVTDGVPASVVDGAARDSLAAAGLGEAFLHATGHGLGLEVHEAPRLARRRPEADERLKAGMVLTVEPGAYVAGLGGVRLEDDVLVTRDGHERLTTAPVDLITL